MSTGQRAQARQFWSKFLGGVGMCSIALRILFAAAIPFTMLALRPNCGAAIQIESNSIVTVPSESKWSEYVALRQTARDDFSGQVELARWCETQGLGPQRVAHLKRALDHSPEDLSIRQMLGHESVNGKWYSPEQLEKFRGDEQASQKRFSDWAEPVSRIAKLVGSAARKRQEAGWQMLSAITDPRAVTAIEAILPQVNERVALRALDAIDSFYHKEATEALLRLGINGRWPSVRERSLDLLKDRNQFDFIPTLISQLASPVESRFAITPDSRGNVVYQYELFQQNFEADHVRQIDQVMLQMPRNSSREGQRALLANASSQAIQAQNELRTLNNSIAQQNQLVQYVLARTTGQNGLTTPQDWWTWWNNVNDVYAPSRPVSFNRTTDIRNYEIPAPLSESQGLRLSPGRGECLVAGTLIATIRGKKPIETLRTGDLVLTRNPGSQSLEYQIVLQPTQRPKTATFRLRLGDEWIQASGGHLFQVPGRGWIRLRDLEVGMAIENVAGSSVRIDEIVPSTEEPLFNLVVDRNANYFVGNSRILSHDSTIAKQGEISVEQQ